MEDIDGSSLVLADDDGSDYGSNLKEWDLDEVILNRLKQNDPSIEKLDIRFNTDDDDEEDNNFSDANDIDWEQEGVSAISENTHIKSLCINIWQNEADNESNMKALLHSVSNNRSIRHFDLDGDIADSGDMMEVLSHCFQHNSVLSFEVDSFFLTARSASLMGCALLKGKSLRKFKLDNINGNEDDLDELASKVVVGLESHSNLKELKLSFDIGNCIYFEDSKWCIELGHLLQSFSKLEVLNLDYSFIYDKGAIALGSGLANCTRLKKLSLCGIRSISSAGWLAIFQGLTSPTNSLLEELTLCINKFYDDILDDDIAASPAKIEIKSLRSLDLNHVKTNSWRSLLTPLLNATSILEKLDLRNSDIDDEGVTGLVDALGNNSTLRVLKIGENRSTFTRIGLVSIFRYLANPRSSLEFVDLSGSYSSSSSVINDELAGILASALCTNTGLKRLDLSENLSISPAGWQVFFNTIRSSNLSLEELKLPGNNIDDNGVTSIVNASASLCSLKVLRLTSNRLITPVGLRAVSTLLRNPSSCLEELHLGDNTNTHGVNIDEVVLAYARELVNNTSLKYLYLGDNNVITSRGLNALSTLLCNKADIESIYTSNHTLQSVDYCLPYLELNKNDDKFEVARQKIIQYHFLNGEDNMQEFVSMELEVLPHAIGWTGRDDTGHSILYQLVRSMPSLFDYESMKAKATTGKISK